MTSKGRLIAAAACVGAALVAVYLWRGAKPVERNPGSAQTEPRSKAVKIDRSASPLDSAPSQKSGEQPLAPFEPNSPNYPAFIRLPIEERIRIGEEFKKLDLDAMFDAILAATRAERDLSKADTFGTLLAGQLQIRPPDAQFLNRLRGFILGSGDPAASEAEKTTAIGILGGAMTKESTALLLELLPMISDAERRVYAINGISNAGNSHGDGYFHEEVLPPLITAWQNPPDPDPRLIPALARAMARLGAPEGVEAVLSAAFDAGTASAEKKAAAEKVIGEIATRNCVLVVSSRLVRQQPTSDQARLLATIFPAQWDPKLGIHVT